MKNLSIAVRLSIIVLLTVLTSLARTGDPVRLEFAISDSIPVSIASAVIYRAYSPEGEFHTIDFSLTNKSEMYIGEVSFTQYELDEKNEVLSATFWSERDGLQPYETRRLSTNDSSVGAQNTKFVWSVHRICTDRGTWRVELNELAKAIPSYVSGGNPVLPKAEFEGGKCPAG